MSSHIAKNTVSDLYFDLSHYWTSVRISCLLAFTSWGFWKKEKCCTAWSILKCMHVATVYKNTGVHVIDLGKVFCLIDAELWSFISVVYSFASYKYLYKVLEYFLPFTLMPLTKVVMTAGYILEPLAADIFCRCGDEGWGSIPVVSNLLLEQFAFWLTYLHVVTSHR